MIESLLSQLLVILLMVGTGYLICKKGLVSERFQGDLAELILWVVLPLSIVEAGVLQAQADAAENILWMIGLSVFTYLWTIFLSKLIEKRGGAHKDSQGVFSCLIIFANTAFVGYPMCMLLLGSKGVFYASFFNMVFSLFFFTYGVGRISGKRVSGIKTMVTRDPGIAATCVMLLLFVFQVRLPPPVNQFISAMGGMCTPLSMLVIGCMLTKVQPRQVVREKSYYLISLCRLLLIPLLTLALLVPLSRLGVDKDVLFVVIIMCAMPAGSLTAIYSEKCGRNTQYVSGGIVHTMIFFVVSMPIVAVVAKWMLYGAL